MNCYINPKDTTTKGVLTKNHTTVKPEKYKPHVHPNGKIPYILLANSILAKSGQTN